MTTNGAKRFKSATRKNLKVATDAWKAETTNPELVDRFTAEMCFEAADSSVGVIAHDLAGQLDELGYIDALEVLAKLGMLLEEADPPEQRAGHGPRDGQLEMGYTTLDELPVSYRHAREARERAR